MTSVIILLTGCMGANTKPTDAYGLSNPKNSPTKNLTSFSESLQCMDALFLKYGVGPYYITTTGVPDKTSQNLGGGTREMLIAAISKASKRSDAFKFIDIDIENPLSLGPHFTVVSGAAEKFVYPDYYFTGAISQLDKSVYAKSNSVSVAFDSADFGTSADQRVSIISIDLNLGRILDRQIINGIDANNSIVVTSAGSGIDSGGKIQKTGVFFNIAFDQKEGTHQAIRALMDLSVLEILGKFTKTPYWQCLSINQTNPLIIQQIEDWFSGMEPAEYIHFVQKTLKNLGFYNGFPHSVLDYQTRTAISRYQAANGLLPTGQINFALYRSLIREDVAKEIPAQKPQVVSDQHNSTAQEPASITLALTPLEVNKNRIVQLSVEAEKPVYLYCYYQDNVGNIAQVYPNPLQQNALIPGNETVLIPENDLLFSIAPQTFGTTEQALCLTTTQEIRLALPEALRKPAFVPLAIGSFSAILHKFKQVTDKQVNYNVLTIHVEKEGALKAKNVSLGEGLF